MDDSNNQKTETLCKVCGDKASGKHYGVASCDGCRGFFKRSIRRNLEYICKENGHCIVDVTRRNQCQACRFKKCLQVNMKRDAVQHERAPRSTSAHSGNLHHYPLGLSRLRPFHFSTIPLHPPLPLDSSLTFPGHYLQHGLMYPGILGSGFNRLTPEGQSIINLTSTPSYNTTKQNNVLQSSRNLIKEDEVSSSEEITRNQTIDEECLSSEETSSQLELPIHNDTYQSAYTRHLELPLNIFPSENVYESAAKLLFLAIKWARTIPSFLQLSHRDQSILLEESWNELFVLTAAQWTFPVDEAILISNAVVPSSRRTALEEDARKLREIVTRLNSLRVDHTEHACLKALVLFKSECRGLCEPTHVELLQDQTHVMLHEYCTQRHNHLKGRFGKLLLTLPAVQGVSRRGLEELLFRQTVGDVAIDRLLGDLAKTTHV